MTGASCSKSEQRGRCVAVWREVLKNNMLYHRKRQAWPYASKAMGLGLRGWVDLRILRKRQACYTSASLPTPQAC